MTRTNTDNALSRIDIDLGLPQTLRGVAAGLYWEAFGRKLGVAIGPRRRGVSVLEHALRADRALVAVSSGELLGLAGFHLGGSSFVGVELGHLTAEFGLGGGVLRAIPLALLERKPNEDELLLDGIVVRSDQRGGGIGMWLLRAAVGLAADNGLGSVRLEVVDTNPRAGRLYAREGFVPVHTVRTPYLRRAMGFSASTTMVKKIRKKR